MSKRSFVVVIAAVGMMLGTVSGDLPDGEPAFEEECRIGSIRNLKGREILDALIRRARQRRLLMWMVALALLLVAVKLGTAESTGPPLLLCLGVSRGATVRGFRVTEDDKEIVVFYPGGARLVLSKTCPYCDQMVDMEIVRLLLLKDAYGKKVFTQAELGKLFGLSRQMVNRRKRLVEETGDLDVLVKREYEKSVLTEDTMRRIAEIVAEDWWKSDAEIAEQLLREGAVRKICGGTVSAALGRIDGRLLRKAIRERIEKGGMNGQMGQGHLVRMLFKLVEELVEGKGVEASGQYVRLKEFAEKTGLNNQSQTGEPKPSQRGPYRRDVEEEPRHTERNRKRRCNILRMAIEGGWNPFKERPVLCPDCLSPSVRLKQNRSRRYKNGGCREEKISSRQYRCVNSECPTKTFTKLPNELEPWARADFFLKRKVLALSFHVRGSLRRVVDYVEFETGHRGPAWTTALGWIRKAGREMVPLESLLPIRWSGTLGVDEKWVKRFGEWVYIYEAIDIETGLPILMRAFPDCNGDNARAVLLEIKARGYIPKIVVTDLIADYEKPVKDIFPDATHQKCLFHAEKAAKKLVRKYLSEDCNEVTRKQLYILLRDLFSAETLTDLETQLAQFLWAREHFPSQAAPVFNMVERIAPSLKQPRQNPEIPTTNNATESAIKEFDSLYRTTGGYSSIPALQDFLDAYIVYLRFRKYSSGPHKGLCPLEVAGYDIGSLDWDFYLLAA